MYTQLSNTRCKTRHGMGVHAFRRRLCAAVLGILVICLPGAAAQDFSLDWWSIDGGAGVSSGAEYKLAGTIGQPDANTTVMTGGDFSLVGGFWPITYYCPGDCNCDGTVDFDDINIFVAVLGGQTPCWFANVDVNGDGAIDFADINPFVAILSGGGPCS